MHPDTKTPFDLKRVAPILAADSLTPGTPVAADLVRDHRNVYLKPVRHPDGRIRDAVVVVEPGPIDEQHPQVAAYHYTIFGFTYPKGDSLFALLGDRLAAGPFIGPAGADLSDDRLHLHAIGRTESPDTPVPTPEQAAALLIPGGLDRSAMRRFPGYIYGLMIAQASAVDCGHGYRLTDSCPSCGVLDDEED